MRHRPLAIALLAALTLGGLPLIGNAAATPAASACTWDAYTDFHLTPLDANPSPDSCGHAGVWTYTSGPAHHPAQYATMAGSEVPAGHPDTLFWCPVACAWDSGGVGANKGDTWSYIMGHEMFAHPTRSDPVIIAWTSPITGVVSINGSVRDDDAGGGNGINWFIDHGAATLASGGYPNGGAQTFDAGAGGASLANVSVLQGETIYLLIDPNGDFFYDTTGVHFTIQPLAPPPAPLPELPSIALAGVGVVLVGLVAFRARK